MKHLLLILALAATASAQTYITVTADTNRAIRTNFSLVTSQIADFSSASFAISNVTGLQTLLDSKLQTNGSAFALTNFPAYVITNTNGIVSLQQGGTGATNATGARSALELGSAATNDASFFQQASTNLTALASGDGSSLTNVIVTDASSLTNFPVELLRTNGDAAGLTNFPSELLRTNGDASGLTNIAVYPPLTNNASKVLAVATNETEVEWVTVTAGGGGDTTTNTNGAVRIPTNNVASYTGADSNYPITIGVNATNTGRNIVIGPNSRSSISLYHDGVIIGRGAIQVANETVVIGREAQAYKTGSVSVGAGAVVTNTGSKKGVQLGSGTLNDSVFDGFQVFSWGVMNESEWDALLNSTAIGQSIMTASNAQAALTNLSIFQGSDAVAITTATNNQAINNVAIGAGARNVTGANTVIGYSATADDGSGFGGVSVGRSAVSSNSSVAIGYSAAATGQGVAVGYQATNTGTGASVGYQANSESGGAVGRQALSLRGFAGGYIAQATATNASQIGTGTNATDNTIQFLSAGTVDTNEWATIAAMSTYPTTNISVVGTNNTNTLVFSNGILINVTTP